MFLLLILNINMSTASDQVNNFILNNDTENVTNGRLEISASASAFECKCSFHTL